MPRDPGVRKTMRIEQEKLDRARELLGTHSDTETVTAALDFVVSTRDENGTPPIEGPEEMEAFRREVSDGLWKLVGMGMNLKHPDDEEEEEAI